MNDEALLNQVAKLTRKLHDECKTIGGLQRKINELEKQRDNAEKLCRELANDKIKLQHELTKALTIINSAGLTL